MTEIEQTTTTAPAYDTYRAPAVSIRAAHKNGDATDELVVDIDQGPVDVAVIRGVIDAMTEKRDAAIEAVREVVTGTPLAQGGNVRAFPAGGTYTNIATAETVLTDQQRNAAGKEAQA
jgi:hypothetical protein